MKIEIKWTDITDDDDNPLWSVRDVLYTYLHPTKDEILYIGKCSSTTVINRWKADDKISNFWRDLREQRGIYEHSIMVGEIYLRDKDINRYSNVLLKDIESALIYDIKPWGNIQCTNSITLTHKLKIHCTGDWYFDVNYFVK